MAMPGPIHGVQNLVLQYHLKDSPQTWRSGGKEGNQLCSTTDRPSQFTWLPNNTMYPFSSESSVPPFCKLSNVCISPPLHCIAYLTAQAWWSRLTPPKLGEASLLQGCMLIAHPAPQQCPFEACGSQFPGHICYIANVSEIKFRSLYILCAGKYSQGVNLVLNLILVFFEVVERGQDSLCDYLLELVSDWHRRSVRHWQ